MEWIPLEIIWQNPGFVLSSLVAAVAFIFGLGVSAAGLRLTQVGLSKNVQQLMGDVESIKVQLQERKAMFVTRVDCDMEQGRCQKSICDKIDRLCTLVEKDRDRLQANAVDIKGLEQKIDMLISQQHNVYGRNSG